MFRKFSLILALLLLATPAFAATLPPMSAGAYYSFKDKVLNQMETFTVASFPAQGKYSNLFNVEMGTAGDAESSNWKGVAALSITIPQLQLKNYINLPVLDLVGFRPAIVAGLGQINGQNLSGAKFDCGIGFTLIQWKG